MYELREIGDRREGMGRGLWGQQSDGADDIRYDLWLYAISSTIYCNAAPTYLLLPSRLSLVLPSLSQARNGCLISTSHTLSLFLLVAYSRLCTILPAHSRTPRCRRPSPACGSVETLATTADAGAALRSGLDRAG